MLPLITMLILSNAPLEAIKIDTDISPSFTLGIEEEYMVIDPLTFNLKSHIDVGLLEKSQLLLHEHVKPEMHGSIVINFFGHDIRP